MNFPIAERELRALARLPKTYFTRVSTSLIFFGITAWLLWAMTKFGRTFSAAAQVFGMISQFCLMMVTFNTATTADSISSEKRAGTLGLLFLTDLKAIDIILGKLAATGLMTVYGLVGLLPILAMPVLMGGIPGESIFRTFLTLVNGVFFALAIGLWISARSVEQKRAANSGIWISVIFLWGFPGISIFLSQKFHWNEFATALMMLSPSYQIDQSSPFAVGMLTDHYWASLLLTHTLGWLAIWRASAILPHEWQDKPAIDAKTRWRRWLHDFRFGNSVRRLTFRRRALDLNPIHWLSARQISAPFWNWFFIGLMMTFWVVLWAWVRALKGDLPFWAAGMPALFALYLGFRLRACALAAEVIARDRFSGALELVLSTTLTEEDVMSGQWKTVRRTMGGPLLATVAIGASVFVLAFHDSRSDQEMRANVPIFFLGMTAMFAVDIVASVWVGLWCGCTTKTVNGAPGLVMLRLMVLPWTTMAIVGTILALLKFQAPGFPLVFGSWWILCVANSFFWMGRSRRLFRERLRIVASERFQPIPEGRLWKWLRELNRSATT